MTDATDVPEGASGATRRHGILARVGLGLAIAALAYTFVWMVANASTRPESGTSSGRSSFSSDTNGLAGYSRLLESYWIDVQRQRGTLGATPDADASVLLVDPPMVDRGTADLLLAFVRSGGRLVTGGPQPDFIALFDDAPPTWQRATRDRWDGSALVAGARDVRTGNEGEWSEPGASIAVVGDERSALVVARTLGAGEIMYLADTTIFTNQLLAQADNAAFTVGLVRDDAPVVFLEGVHGFEQTSGLAALPDRWKLAIAGLLLAGLLLLWSRGTRFGPPEAAHREFDPPRARYIEALADTLARTGPAPPATDEEPRS